MVDKDSLGFSKDNQETYSNLVKLAGSPFYKKDYADVFLFSIALAIYRELPPTPVQKKVDNIPLSAFGNRIWILNALAVSKAKSHKALFDKAGVFDLAERYANTGIALLKKEVYESDGDFYSRIESYCK